MPEAASPLSAAALRLAGHVGQTALDRIVDTDVAAIAELDQHMAAVRAELAACQQRPAIRPRGVMRRGGRTGHTINLATRLALLRSTKVRCPDFPFVSDARQADATIPVTLLLHYASGFVEAAISDDWWPADSADATDWVSLRLAAICQLIAQAEAAGGLHPDLRTSA